MRLTPETEVRAEAEVAVVGEMASNEDETQMDGHSSGDAGRIGGHRRGSRIQRDPSNYWDPRKGPRNSRKPRISRNPKDPRNPSPSEDPGAHRHDDRADQKPIAVELEDKIDPAAKQWRASASRSRRTFTSRRALTA